MKTTRLTFVSGICFMFLILAGCTGGKDKTDPAAKSGAAAGVVRTVEVVYIEGEVRVDGSPVEIGARLGTRFVVATGANARCDIVFDGHNALSVGKDAIAEFDLSAAVGMVRLHQGGLSSVLKKLALLTDKDSFIVSTSQAVAGVRGTSFCVWADSSSTYVCACNGAVHTLDAAGGNEEVIESAHHSARLYKTSVSSAISKEVAGLLHHSDDSLQSVASRIGYTIDWTKEDK